MATSKRDTSADEPFEGAELDDDAGLEEHEPAPGDLDFTGHTADPQFGGSRGYGESGTEHAAEDDEELPGDY